MEDGSLRWGKAIYLGWETAVSRLELGVLWRVGLWKRSNACSVVVDAKVEDEIYSIVPHDSQDQSHDQFIKSADSDPPELISLIIACDIPQ